MKTVHCPIKTNQTDRLLDLVAGRLAGAELDALRDHTAACEPCTEFVAEQAAVWAAMETMPAVAVSADFDARLRRRIAEQESDSWLVRTWRRWFASAEPVAWRPAMAVSGIACAVVLGVALWRPVAVPVTSQPAVKASVEAVTQADVEMVESALEDLEIVKLAEGSKL